MLVLLGLASPARGAFDDPVFAFAPKEPRLNGPCGLAVDSTGRLLVSNHRRREIDLFELNPSEPAKPLTFKDFTTTDNPLAGPCGLGISSTGGLYVNDFHQDVQGPGLNDAANPTGVAVDDGDYVYVDDRTYVAVYEPSGAPVMDGSIPLRIGNGSLGDGYGLAISGFPATKGWIYVPDADDDAVKVYNPAVDPTVPVATIAGPPGGFRSLRNSAVAVDDATGEIYVIDTLGPQATAMPRAAVYVFTANGSFEGRLKYGIVDGEPSGLAVDNSGGPTQSHVYVTSGNTDEGGIYAYPPGAATAAALAPIIPDPPKGAESIFPTTPVGSPAPPPQTSEITCEGDSCQFLAPEPVDPTLTTRLEGLGNPKIHYRNTIRRCRPKRKRRSAAATSHCARAGRGGSSRPKGAATSSAAVAGAMGAPPGTASQANPGNFRLDTAASGLDFAAGPLGLSAEIHEDGAPGISAAGAHPYDVTLTVGLDQSDGPAHLRNLSIALPAGLLTNFAAVKQCSSATFDAPRSSPFEASDSGESCAGDSQVGTVEVQTETGEPRTFGLFNLEPPSGVPAQFGASPFGKAVVFDLRIRPDSKGAYAFFFEAVDIPQNLDARALDLTLWGAPWAATHDVERDDCLNEGEPEFPWSKCSVGEPVARPPAAYLTMPTRCGEALAFDVRATAWQLPGEISGTTVNRNSLGQPIEVTRCSTLDFEATGESFLTSTSGSTPSGFTFRQRTDVGDGFANPRRRIVARPRRVAVVLPEGVTLNAAMGAGLGICTPARYAAETAFNPPGAGCPSQSKIGGFRLRLPFYSGLLEGNVYLAMPDDKRTTSPGAENPLDSLVTVYLIAKSAKRGILVKLTGKIEPDDATGLVTAVFDDLPQVPFTDLEVNFNSGQRAPLVTSARCGTSAIKVVMTPWSGGAAVTDLTNSTVKTGIDGGPCPNGSVPPFKPRVLAGGVNSNVGSYTPYFVHISREDADQQITSYSLVLPKGITGKIAGIPFCPDAAIAAARDRGGFQETDDPSCPAASRVGRTVSSYAAGDAFSHAPGNIYLAGPYHGQPLSLVTIDAATVGSFDLGTIVIRSAFSIDPHTGQLEIDSRASDPIPHILAGFPLNLREVRVYIDRPEFIHNPTSCEPSELESTLTGSGARLDDPSDNSTVTLPERFQLLNCLTLGFRPKLGIQLRGGTRRGAYPSLRATFTSRGPKDADLEQIEVVMPHSEFLAQNHIRQICTRVEFAAESCPESSSYGRAVARTPLFDEPLRGNVYLRSSSSRLPDLVADLRSGSVRIILEGRIAPAKHGIRVFFADLPDAPIERFTMTLRGGRRGLLVNSANICDSPPVASVKALGQNNVGAVFTTVLRGHCKADSAPDRGRDQKAQERSRS